MKKLSLLVVVIFCSYFITAQTVLLSPQSYQNLKQNGQLIQGVDYKFIASPGNTANKNTIGNTSLIQTQQAAKTTTTAGACACYVPIDPTFSVVSMSAGTGPSFRNDDGSSASIPLGFNFCFYGTTYNSCFINNNGNITFGTAYSAFSSTGFPTTVASMIAPFWADVDTRNLGSGLVYFKQTPTALIVKWSNVGYYSNMADKVNDFQLIITNGSDPLLPNSNNVAFCFGDMQWTTGSASGPVGGFGGTASTTGVNKGDGTNFIQITRSDQPGTSYDGPYGLNDGISFLDNKSYFFNTCGTNNNLPPIIQDATGGGSACGDTIRICALGDTLVYTTSFLAPENTQSITVTGSAPTLGGSFQPLGATTTTAGITTYVWRVVATPTVTGVHTVIVTGTDNGSPNLSSSATYFIKIQNIPVPQPTLAILPATGTVCATPGATITLVNFANYDNVYWSNGSSGNSTIVNTTGVVYVTVNKLGCYKSSSDTINVFTNPVPIVLGARNYCPPATTTTLTLAPPLVGNAAYTSYTWTPGPVNTATASLNGTPAGKPYTVTVTDANGCKGSATFSVSTSTPTLGITANPLSVCGVGTSTLTGSTILGATSYIWSNGSTTQSTTVNTGGVYTLTVTVNNCVSTKTVNVNISPTPTVVITPTVNLCAGSTGTIAVVSFSPTGSYTYTWSTGSQSPTIAVSTNTVVSLLVTNTVTGCRSDTSNKASVIISTNLPPDIIIGGPLNYCPPSSTNTTIFVGPPNNGMSAYASYSWTPGGFTGSSATLTGPANYTVTVTDVNGCSSSLPFSISNTQPTLTLSASPNPVCGTTSTLSTSISGASSYAWSNGATTPTIIVTSSGTYSAIVTANNCTVPGTISIVINPTPTVTIPSNVGICSGASATISPTSLAPSPTSAYTYTWSNGSNANTVTVSNPIVITLAVTNTLTGCTAISNPCTVLAGTNPIVSLSLNNAVIVYCNGANALLTPTVTGGTPAYTYSWTPASLGTSSTVSTSIDGLYYVKVTDQNFCTGSATVAIQKSFPSVILSSPDLTICPTDCAVITANATSVSSPFTYTWSNTTTQSSATNTVCSAGTVTVLAKDGIGCIVSNTITVENDISPVASFTFTPPSPVAPGQIINYTSTSSISTGSISGFVWQFGDGSGTSGNPVTHSYANAGVYTVTLTVSGSVGCSNQAVASIIVDAPIVIPNIITPNGDNANDLLKFKNLEAFNNNTLTIFNRWGTKIFSQDNYKNDWGGSGQVDGTYFFILNVPEASPNVYKGFFQILR